MALSNRDRVSKGLDLLKVGLLPFVEREMRAVYGDDWEDQARQGLRAKGKSIQWDTAALLNVLWNQWQTVFRKTLGPAERSLASELRQAQFEARASSQTP